jgi:S-adenosylmethionine:tRNA ribosyltransferase-isomerase
MTLSRSTGRIADRKFSELPTLLRKGDLVVLNDTKVLRGRLKGERAGGGTVEVFLLSLKAPDGKGGERWEALARPSKRLKEGEELLIGGLLGVRLERRLGEGRWPLRRRDSISTRKCSGRYRTRGSASPA